MPGPARSVVTAFDATPLLGHADGGRRLGRRVRRRAVGRSRCGRRRLRPQRDGRPVAARCASRHRPGRTTDPDPGCRPAPGVAALRAPCSGALDRAGGRCARHQLRRPPFAARGPVGHRARPDPGALPRALQPDLAAVSPPHPTRPRPRRIGAHRVTGDGRRGRRPLPARPRPGPRHPQRPDAPAASAAA